MGIFSETISNEEVAALPAGVFDGPIVVVDSEKGLAAACADLVSAGVIGFDTETRPSFRAGVVNRTALLQLSTASRSYLFRLCRMRFDKALVRILENPKVIKVGAAVSGDIQGLQSLRHFRPAGFVDLQNIVGEWGIAEKSVRKMSAIVLGRRISKAQRLSNWEAQQLTGAQQLYAATDAWVCLEIYGRLLASPKVQENDHLL